jgi:hypothetical protein
MAPAIPKGSLVLVTGANGPLALMLQTSSWKGAIMCGEQLDMSPKSKVLGALWEKKFGEETFDLATLEDMAKDGAFNEAIKDR